MEAKDLELPLEWVRQPYPITTAQNNFNVREMRIMLRITQALQGHMEYDKDRIQVQTDLLGNKTLFLDTKSLLPEEDHHHDAVKKALAGLTKKPIIIKGRDTKGDYKIETRLILRYKYYYNKERVEVLIDKDLLSSYLALAKNYSRYLLNVAFSSSSPYAIKLYQFVSHWKDKGAIEVKVEELREWLQIGDKYKQTRDLKKNVLEPAIKELKEKADVWFEIEQPIKEGRRIVGWNIRIFQKNGERDKQPEQQGERDKRLGDLIFQKILNNLRNYFKLSDDQLLELQPILSKPELYRLIYEKLFDVVEQVKKGAVQNPDLYVLGTLKREYGDRA